MRGNADFVISEDVIYLVSLVNFKIQYHFTEVNINFICI